MDKLKLSTLQSNKPIFHFFGREYELAGCGATALSFITGDNPYVIKYSNKGGNESHFSDKFMVDFLKKKDFTIEKITNPKLFRGKKRTTAFEEKITDSHVLLCCIKLGKGFSSWCVIFRGKYLVHNFQLINMTAIDFLNWPLHDESRYIISHPNWKQI